MHFTVTSIKGEKNKVMKLLIFGRNDDIMNNETKYWQIRKTQSAATKLSLFAPPTSAGLDEQVSLV